MFDWFVNLFKKGKKLYDKYKDDPNVEKIVDKIEDEIKDRTKLKDGSIVDDGRLDRIEMFDERSKWLCSGHAGSYGGAMMFRDAINAEADKWAKVDRDE